MLSTNPCRNGPLIYTEGFSGLLLRAVVADKLFKNGHECASYGNAHNSKQGYTHLQAYGRPRNTQQMEFKERLKQARKHARLTQTELGTAVGIDQTSISDLERGKSQSTSFIAEIAKACGVDALWLATGQGAMHSYSVGSKHAGDQLELAERAAPYAPKPESNAVMIGMMSAWDSDTPLHDDEVAIPFYKEVEMAAGSGATEVVVSIRAPV